MTYSNESIMSSGSSLFTVFVDPSSKDSSTIFPFEGCNIETASQETIMSLVDRSPILHRLGSTKIVRISQKLVLKSGPGVLPSEAENMRFASAHTSIRIPKVHRSFNVPGRGYFETIGYIVMDYVEGVCLADCWNELNPEKRQSVVLQVAGMIQQLQSVRLDNPGPIGGGPSQGMWFTEYSAGPFATRQEIERWFNHKLDICKGTRNARQDIPPFDFPTFVLTHQDISPRNLIVDPSDQVWLIDWGFAGAYPPCFEAATLVKQLQFPDFSQQLLEHIHTDPQQIAQLRSIEWGVHVAAFA